MHIPEVLPLSSRVLRLDLGTLYNCMKHGKQSGNEVRRSCAVEYPRLGYPAHENFVRSSWPLLVWLFGSFGVAWLDEQRVRDLDMSTGQGLH